MLYGPASRPSGKNQEGAAEDPKALKAPVSTYVPITKVASFSDRGFPTVPQLEEGRTCQYGSRTVAFTDISHGPICRWVGRPDPSVRLCASSAMMSVTPIVPAAASTTPSSGGAGSNPLQQRERRLIHWSPPSHRAGLPSHPPQLVGRLHGKARSFGSSGYGWANPPSEPPKKQSRRS
ncbi:unnamed protein product [Scomber scombrus]|uniref:Unnamed protein product n=1 Tax=Scomber scombrus TaxID=13677 RepID=A0AAV1PYW5_SCOSC